MKINLTDSPAAKVIRKFGGAYAMSHSLHQLADRTGDPSVCRSPSVIFRWTYPKDRGGTGGYVPTSVMAAVRLAARLDGILIAPEEFYG